MFVVMRADTRAAAVGTTSSQHHWPCAQPRPLCTAAPGPPSWHGSGPAPRPPPRRRPQQLRAWCLRLDPASRADAAGWGPTAIAIDAATRPCYFAEGTPPATRPAPRALPQPHLQRRGHSPEGTPPAALPRLPPYNIIKRGVVSSSRLASTD